MASEPDLDDDDANPPASDPIRPLSAKEQRLFAAQLEVAEIFGNIAAFWGFTRTQGRIYGLLFVSPEPVPQSELRDRLEISAGSASMTLASLLDWGVVHREGRMYVAETDLWKAITGVMRRRERAEVESAIQRMSAVVQSLRDAGEHAPRLRFALERTQILLEFFELGRNFLDAFVVRGPVHGLLGSIARRAARFPALLSRRDPDVRVGH
jgi:DNA-binding transcriptional regulator GbsR (MarR family)